MPSKDGWTLECEHAKITLGKKMYRNMEEWKRPCTVCGEKFSIYTRANAGAVNSSFGLKTCKEHRGQRINGGVAVGSEEVEALRKELAEAQEANVEMAVMIGQLKRQLAAYDLPAAMAAMPWQK